MRRKGGQHTKRDQTNCKVDTNTIMAASRQKGAEVSDTHHLTQTGNSHKADPSGKHVIHKSRLSWKFPHREVCQETQLNIRKKSIEVLVTSPSRPSNHNQNAFHSQLPKIAEENSEGSPDAHNDSHRSDASLKVSRSSPENFQTASRRKNSHQGAPQSSRDSQGAPQSPRDSQGAPQSFRDSQGTPQSSRDSQGTPQSFKDSQRAPQSSRDSSNVWCAGCGRRLTRQTTDPPSDARRSEDGASGRDPRGAVRAGPLTAASREAQRGTEGLENPCRPSQSLSDEAGSAAQRGSSQDQDKRQSIRATRSKSLKKPVWKHCWYVYCCCCYHPRRPCKKSPKIQSSVGDTETPADDSKSEETGSHNDHVLVSESQQARHTGESVQSDKPFSNSVCNVKPNNMGIPSADGVTSHPDHELSDDGCKDPLKKSEPPCVHREKSNKQKSSLSNDKLVDEAESRVVVDAEEDERAQSNSAMEPLLDRRHLRKKAATVFYQRNRSSLASLAQGTPATDGSRTSRRSSSFVVSLPPDADGTLHAPQPADTARGLRRVNFSQTMQVIECFDESEWENRSLDSDDNNGGCECFKPKYI